MDTVKLLEGLSGQHKCVKKKNHYQSTWKHTACQLACPGVLYWFSPVPSFKSSNTTALLKAAHYLCTEATILDISSIYIKTPTQPPDFKVSFMDFGGNPSSTFSGKHISVLKLIRAWNVLSGCTFPNVALLSSIHPESSGGIEMEQTSTLSPTEMSHKQRKKSLQKHTAHNTAVKNLIIPFLQKHPFFRKKGFEIHPQLAIKAPPYYVHY